MVHPGVQLKPVEGDTLPADRDFGEVGADFRVEAVSVHPEIEGGVSESHETGQEAELVVHRSITPQQLAHRPAKGGEHLRGCAFELGVTDAIGRNQRQATAILAGACVPTDEITSESARERLIEWIQKRGHTRVVSACRGAHV